MILLRSSPSKVGTVCVFTYLHQVTLSWTILSDSLVAITNYVIQDSTDDSTWSVSTDEIRNDISSTISSLTNNTSYYFTVVLRQFPRYLNLS